MLQTTSKAQASAGKLADQAKQLIVKQLNNQKDRATGSLESLINVLRQGSQQLQDQGQAPVASLANRAADGIEQVWVFLSERDVVDLEREGEQFARTQPAIFLTGTFALGFLGARFFKSSRQSVQNGSASSAYVWPAALSGRANAAELRRTCRDVPDASMGNQQSTAYADLTGQRTLHTAIKLACKCSVNLVRWRNGTEYTAGERPTLAW